MTDESKSKFIKTTCGDRCAIEESSCYFHQPFTNPGQTSAPEDWLKALAALSYTTGLWPPE